MDQLLYTPEEAGECLRIGRTKVFELMRRGDLASVKIGNLRRIPANALHSYVHSLTTEN